MDSIKLQCQQKTLTREEADAQEQFTVSSPSAKERQTVACPIDISIGLVAQKDTSSHVCTRAAGANRKSTFTCDGWFSHESEGDGASIGIWHLHSLLQDVRQDQGRRPVHLCTLLCLPAHHWHAVWIFQVQGKLAGTTGMEKGGGSDNQLQFLS